MSKHTEMNTRYRVWVKKKDNDALETHLHDLFTGHNEVTQKSFKYRRAIKLHLVYR